MKLLIMQFSPISRHFISLRTKYSPQTASVSGPATQWVHNLGHCDYMWKLLLFVSLYLFSSFIKYIYSVRLISSFLSLSTLQRPATVLKKSISAALILYTIVDSIFSVIQCHSGDQAMSCGTSVSPTAVLSNSSCTTSSKNWALDCTTPLFGKTECEVGELTAV
jgi:hypothetical protein